MWTRLLLGTALALGGMAGTAAAGPSAAESCVDAGLRPGTGAFTSCLMHIQGEDPSTKIGDAPAPAISEAEAQPPLGLSEARDTGPGAQEIRLLEHERPGGPALVLLNGQVVPALSPGVSVPGGSSPPPPAAGNPVGVSVPAPMAPSLPGMQVFSAPNWPWGGGTP